MKYKSGDVVIKTTGGNKMTIFDKVNDSYKCLWFVENTINESIQVFHGTSNPKISHLL